MKVNYEVKSQDKKGLLLGHTLGFFSVILGDLEVIVRIFKHPTLLKQHP